MPLKFDVIVIGTGAGGGTAGWRLARAGKKVLFVERGRLFSDETLFQDEQAMHLDKMASDNRFFNFGGLTQRPFIGGIVGGSTALYGACLMRPGQSDFSPGRYYGQFLEPDFWDWPITYEDLAPYYQEAENVYRVAGCNQPSPPFLEPRKAPYPHNPLDLHPTNHRLLNLFKKNGLQPFILPLGIDPTQCLKCPTCPGFICPNTARASSYNRCIENAVLRHGAVLWPETEVVNVRLKGRTISELTLQKDNGQQKVTADVIILAAGALGSPIFLEQHELTGDNPWVGRNFMFHLGVIFTAVGLKPTGAGREFIKQLGLTDYYLTRAGSAGTPKIHKLGYIQQLPLPGTLVMRSELPIPAPLPVLKVLLERNITFAGAIEDLPRNQNRVFLKNKTIHVRHAYHPYDIFRAKLLQKKFLPILRKLPLQIAFSMIARNEKLHTAHQVGTCRFGTNPATSVLDPQCRVHHFDNLYVLDGSFMPTSLGVAPALTIMANALRVANHLIT